VKNLKEYHKPKLVDMSEYEMRSTNGGGFPVFAGALVAVIVVVAGYTVGVAGVIVAAGAAATVGLGANVR